MTLATHRSAASTHQASPPHDEGPPPPPAAPGGAGESRSTAAGWVAAVGAVLLLAAAGTFLAVSWAALELTARVAVVGGITGAAIVGGHRLRRTLPAVGTVVFHLGALLLPVDALGLAIQLDASPAARWAAVGGTAALALPALSIAGGSRLLALAGLAGIPALATSAGLASTVAPGVVLVGCAALTLALEVAGPSVDDRHPLASARVFATPLLAAGAVVIPLVLTLTARLAAADTVLGSAAAGWVADGWRVPAVVGSVAVGLLATLAARRRDLGIAGLTVVTAVLAVVVTLLPPDTPRAVVFLAPALVWLVAEAAALAGRHDGLWAGPTRGVATAIEVLGTIAGMRAVGMLTADAAGWDAMTLPDPALAAQAAVFAAAWALGGARLVTTPHRAAVAVAMAGLSVVHVATASRFAGWPAAATAAILLAGMLASLLVLAAGRGRGPGAGTHPVGRTVERLGRLPEAAATTAPFAALLLGVLATVVLIGDGLLLLVVVGLPAVLAAHLAARIAHGADGWFVATLLVAAVPALGWATALLEAAATLPDGVASLVGASGLLVLASATHRLEPAADTLRALALVAGLLVTVPELGTGTIALSGQTGAWWAVGLRLVPGAVAPAAVIAAWLLAEGVRARRTTPIVLAVPVLMRLLAALLLEFGAPVTATGVVLGVVALAATAVALAGPSVARPAAVTAAAVAGPLGWLLIGPSPVLRASATTAVGLGLATVGLTRRRFVMANVGGVLATAGAWQLCDLYGVDAGDVRALPVAVHLTVAGVHARRRGTSSWIAYVPPLLLVAVPALVERVDGGPGGHAVLAGTLAVVAIVTGGIARLGGPLVVGTLVAVAVVAVETLALVAAVPTWVWLAVGGVVLLAAAALIERLGGSPVRAVRRAVDVVGERFA